jgi:predicted DNA-binding transcriptional regulator AlpA
MAKLVSRPELADFDNLPDSARAPLPIVCGLFSISPATAWRRVSAGLLPTPIKEGNTTRWVVGDLRKALAKRGGQ